MQDTTVEHVFINLSKRSVKILDNEGYDKEVEWKWDREGSEGFAETADAIQNVIHPDKITYCIAVK